MRLFLVVALALAPAAAAREVATGAAARVPVDGGSRYLNIVWVEPRGDDGMLELIELEPAARIGDRYDIVDERGYLAGARVTGVEPVVCGRLRYARARARVSWPGLLRRPSGLMVALGPARGRWTAARVLRRDEVRATGDRARLLVDLDGDGRADLARRLTLECGISAGRGTACIETWVRDGAGDVWRRVARAEVGSCR